MGTTATVSHRLAALQQLVLDLAAGNLGARVEPSEAGDEIDAIAAGLNMLAAGLAASRAEVAARQAEHEHSTAVLRAILGRMNEGVVAGDAAKNVLVVNPAVRRIIGVDTSEPDWLMGVRETMRLPDGVTALGPDDGPLRRAVMGETFDGLELFLLPVPGRDGTFIDCSGAPLTNDRGESIGGMVVIRDITERKRAEASLRQAKDEAEAATAAKSEFLANMSHEIRTPMNGIIGMTELLLETDITRHQREYLDLVKTSADSLLDVINSILDFSKIEAGRMELDPHPVALRDCVGDAVRTLAVRAHQKGLALACRFEEAVPEEVLADAGRLRQIVINLVGNAVKFTARGEVVVEVGMTPGDDGGPMLRVAVSDTGVGIPESKHVAIFESFTQADGSTTRQFGGTGLGLAIAARLVALMGGRLWVESEEGRGSRFHFTARVGLRAEGRSAQAAEPPAAVGAGPAAGRRLRVLLAEDNPVNQLLATRILERRGHAVVLVENGEDAVAAVAAGRFDVVLMDVQMPRMNGLDATREIRRREDGARLPIIALTAHAMPRDREECLAAGMDGYLTKPIRAVELHAAIAAATGSAGAPGPAAAEDEPADAAYDHDALLSRCEGDLELVREVATIFLEEVPSLLAAVTTALHEGDLRRIRAAAHALRGSLTYFGARAATNAAERLERAETADDLAAAPEHLRALTAHVQRLRAALAALAG
ncbi:MAG: ATP-binding protein [Deltaproteobacteria bacterium]|nr:ATP-binding protein [Myxococcales bacterium]MDP3219097.1 ATP-binding protein [Deltaproteobacteria bacterium]